MVLDVQFHRLIFVFPTIAVRMRKVNGLSLFLLVEWTRISFETFCDVQLKHALECP